MADNDKITELANRIYALDEKVYKATGLSLIHISEPTRP